MDTQYAVIGGGVVGLSIAYGLQKLGAQVAVFDQGDTAVRASRGNFGLIYIQGKGLKQPVYARWNRNSAAAWKGFADGLTQGTGIDLALVQDGGYVFHLDEAAMQQESRNYAIIRRNLGGDYPFETMDHATLKAEEPNIGPNVAGAMYFPEDGHVNPLKLLLALSGEVRRRGGKVRVNCHVTGVTPLAKGFAVSLSDGREFRAPNVILTAGLGAAKLGPGLGFKASVRPEQGQLLVTEKLPRIINRPSLQIRQMNEGGVQIGVSNEDRGMDDREDLEVAAAIAREAIQIMPVLARARLVRNWAALRIMSPDGLPIYQQSALHPGAFMVTCHSGITLAAAHAEFLPLWITGQGNAPDVSVFSEDRFDV